MTTVTDNTYRDRLTTDPLVLLCEWKTIELARSCLHCRRSILQGVGERK